MTSPCCAHSAEDHQTVAICEEQIHYPSEDYMCLCAGFVNGAGGSVCEVCGHPVTKHTKSRVCRPASGEFCPCRQVS